MAVLYDLGAEGGVPKKWHSKNFKLLFPKTEIVAFDLDETKLAAQKSRSNLTVLDKIISDTVGKQSFYVPVRHSGSSLYPFNKDYEYLHHDKYHKLEKIIEVETSDLKSLILEKKIPPADIIKMDIQGAELSALIGMGEYIENVHLLELEVEFIPIYKDQPTFTDIHSFLMKSGFHLQDLHLSKSFLTNGRARNYFLKKITGTTKNVNWTPQVYAGDAIYVKDIKSVMKMELKEQVHHLKCLASYNCFDRVFYIISKSEYRHHIEDSKFYKELLEISRAGKVKTKIASVMSKFFKLLGIQVSPIFDRKYPWMERKFPNL